MRLAIGVLVVTVVAAAVLVDRRNARPAWAADKPVKPAPIAPAQELPEGWEEQPFDRRYMKLMYELAQVSEELKAVIQRQVFNVAGQGRAKGKARTADESIVRQWANGGGPVRWTKFYGRTSDEFYLPGPVSVAIAADGQGGVAAAFSRGSPQLKERPPQFDFIEKAQVKIKADAAVRADGLAKRLPDLIARRKELEARQVQLWSQIAFHEVRRRDLKNKQSYRYEPRIPASDPASANQDSLRVVVVLMRRVVSAVHEANELEPRAFERIASLAERTRVELTDAWTRQELVIALVREGVRTKVEPTEIWHRPGMLEVGLASEPTTTRTARGSFLVLARMLEDQAVNLDELYAEALADAQSGSGSLTVKTERWEQLSESLVEFGAALLTMDRTATELASAWNAKPDLDRPLDEHSGEPATPREVDLDPRRVSSSGSADVAPAHATVELSKLREIKIQWPDRKKRKKWAEHAVSHKDGVSYVKRADGTKTPLSLHGNKLSWQKPKGAEVQIDMVQKKTDDGNSVRLIFGS